MIVASRWVEKVEPIGLKKTATTGEVIEYVPCLPLAAVREIADKFDGLNPYAPETVKHFLKFESENEPLPDNEYAMSYDFSTGNINLKMGLECEYREGDLYAYVANPKTYCLYNQDSDGLNLRKVTKINLSIS